MQLFQWVYGMQCMEMHCLLDEEGGEETEHGEKGGSECYISKYIKEMA